jgi:streptomycin 6-kinase
MLKLAIEAEERFGVMLMDWWDGDGAARVLARDDDAILLERAEGTASLADMARNGRDDEACRVLCAVAGRLHASRPQPLPELVPLPHWFRELEPAAATHGILARCAEAAQALLAKPREV